MLAGRKEGCWSNGEQGPANDERVTTLTMKKGCICNKELSCFYTLTYVWSIRYVITNLAIVYAFS